MEVQPFIHYFVFQSAFMNHNDPSIEAINDIRQIMERSSRFLSLSGWSGIMAGIFSLLASFIAYQWIYGGQSQPGNEVFDFHRSMDLLLNLSLLALGVLVATLAFAFFFTSRQAKRDHQKLWNPASRRLIINLFVPMIAGAIFIAAMLYQGSWEFIAGASLVFYGLGLVNASKFTLSDVRIVGYLEMLTGLTSLFFPAYGLFFWAFGFGIIHLFYGILMYFKYDMKPSM